VDVDRFLKQAVALALENVRHRRARPFGAVLVRDGQEIATGVNEIAITGDPTAHAELQAIRAASRATGELRFDNCAMFASGHPCPMCLAAMYLVGIRDVYCAFSLDDAEPYGLSTADLYADLARAPRERAVRVVCARPASGDEHPYEVWRALQRAGGS
jgi:tRNA(Arg) A34 adenosine deaminase TadA